MDLKRAFERIGKGPLIKKLEGFGIKGKVLR